MFDAWMGDVREKVFLVHASFLMASAGVLLPTLADTATAATVGVYVHDQGDRPLQYAVALLTGADGTEIPFEIDAKVGEIGQFEEAFRPYVSAISRGSTLKFTNNDRTAHHVYSFSEAKPLDTVVPSGWSSDAYVFDVSGTVSLGCNIHDHMAAFLYVAPSPYFGIAGENGWIEIEGVPPGTYGLWTWHPRLPRSTPTESSITVDESGTDVEVKLKVRRKRGSSGAPSREERAYK